MAIQATTNRVNQRKLAYTGDASGGILIGPYRVRRGQKDGDTCRVSVFSPNSGLAYTGSTQIYVLDSSILTELQFAISNKPPATATALTPPFSQVLEYGGDCNVWVQCAPAAGTATVTIEM